MGAADADVDRCALGEIYADPGSLDRELEVHGVASVADAEPERTDLRRQHQGQMQTAVVKLHARVTPG